MTDQHNGVRGRFGRRRLLGGAGLLGLGATTGALTATQARSGGAVRTVADEQRAAVQVARSFHGAHQRGILDSAPANLIFVGYDLSPNTQPKIRDSLRILLRDWSAAAATAMAGQPVGRLDLTAGLGPAGLTVTIGIGASALTKAGLSDRIPDALAPLPAFPGEKLDPARSDGDLGVQVCAEDPVVAAAAARALSNIARGTLVKPRWVQRGFLRSAAASTRPDATPRNLMGQVDGTNNPKPTDPGFDQAVWAADPAWMRGGSYLVCRRIRMLLEKWENQPLDAQERVIGRRKNTGAPLSGGDERTPPDFTALAQSGQPLIPQSAHVRIAHPDFNKGARMLRRGYSYDDGYDKTGADAGLFLQAFQADPHHAFVPVQRRMTDLDALVAFVRHEASALFAVPPGASQGGYVGELLLEG